MGFTDVLKQFLERAFDSMHITSAGGDSPKVNTVRDYDINPADFDSIIRVEMEKIIGESRQLKPFTEKIEEWEGGNVQDIQNMSSAQFGNIKSIAASPIGFIIGMLSKQLIKIVSVVGIAFLIAEIVKFVLDEAMKPGRMLDRRFRLTASEEVMNFWTHQEQEMLRRGFKDIRVSSMSGLRGGASQVSGNMFQHQSQLGTLQATTLYQTDIAPTPALYHNRPFTVGRNGDPTRSGWGGGLTYK